MRHQLDRPDCPQITMLTFNDLQATKNDNLRIK